MAALVVGGLMGAPTSAAIASGPVAFATEQGTVSLRAYGDTVVWSRLNPGRNRYELLQRRAGVTSRVAIASAARPFDFDLGPGRDGAPTIVYTACRRRVGHLVKECSIRRYDLRTGRLGTVGGVKRPSGEIGHPAIWRDRLAFTSLPVRRGGEGRPQRIYLKQAGKPLRRMRAGTVGRSDDGLDGTITSLDLRGSRIAFSWFFTAPTRICRYIPRSLQLAQELWVEGATRTRLARSCIDEGVSGSHDHVFLSGARVYSVVIRYSPDGQQSILRLSRKALDGSQTREYDLLGSPPPEALGGYLDDEQRQAVTDLVDATASGGTLFFAAQLRNQTTLYAWPQAPPLR